MKNIFNKNWGMKSKSNMNQIKQRNQFNYILSFQFKLSWRILHFYSFYNSYYWVIFLETGDYGVVLSGLFNANFDVLINFEKLQHDDNEILNI